VVSKPWLGFNQRSDFNVVEFYRVIKKLGYFVTWSKSAICPCITKDDSGTPDFNCPLCKGKGRYWFDPQLIQGIMTNFNEDVRYQQLGEIQAGASYFTTLPENKLGFWDKLANEDSKIRHSEIVERGDHGVKDKLRFSPIEINNLRTVKEEFAEGLNFKFDEVNKSIEWLSDEPMRGTRYTVDYLCHPVWLVIDLINVLRDTLVKSKKPGVTFTELPVRALVKLEFFTQ